MCYKWYWMDGWVSLGGMRFNRALYSANNHKACGDNLDDMTMNRIFWGMWHTRTVAVAVYDSDDYDEDDENHDDEPELNTGENVNADHHQNLETGDTAKSLTMRTVAVEDKIHGAGAPKWVDNPGQDG